ncbi:hypothetical protein [Mycoplasmopsis pulmonis]|uniref:hypothetical protein n=1 Tax=Mycoplasmopsis pulmonis TaxID=2107 RepID=UPI000314447B|nr:hypothetical protein [Mycoplasmopsis pulmonis]VEU68308.1 Uncharacterised protein [Mycoplasmopsis pulmonis]
MALAYTLLCVLLIISAAVFIFQNKSKDPNVIQIALALSLIVLILWIAMIGILFWKWKKIPYSFVEDYVETKILHEQLILGKKDYKVKPIWIKIGIFNFYWWTISPVFSLMALIVLFFTASKIKEQYFFTIYIFIAYNLLNALIALIKLINISPFKIKVEKMFLDKLRQNKELIYATNPVKASDLKQGKNPYALDKIQKMHFESLEFKDGHEQSQNTDQFKELKDIEVNDLEVDNLEVEEIEENFEDKKVEQENQE